MKNINSGLPRIEINPEKYVVFDVETNGLKSKEDDLLSITFYKPDDGKIYNRFLPLELSNRVKTTRINGITKKTLAGAKPLTQTEFDSIIDDFQLESRTILTYSGRGFDETFLREYLKRKSIKGFNKLKFYNFKKQIISSKFSGGTATKDNLCKMFGIGNVQEVHSGINDCYLEWELFKKLDGYYYLITESLFADNVFRLTSDYIIPVSYLSSHPSLSKLISERPYITCESKEVYSYTISARSIKKFETNFNGMIIENLLDSMLDVKEQDSFEFLLDNKNKLEYVGCLNSAYDPVLMNFKTDGTVSAEFEKDKGREIELNENIERFRSRLSPLVQYIKNDLFEGSDILSQELVVDKKHNVLAMCDLSSDDTILEIKTNSKPSEYYKEQLFYESRGRKCYHLQMEWKYSSRTFNLTKIIFKIMKVNVGIGAPPSRNWTQGRREQRRQIEIEKLKDVLNPINIDVIDYVDSITPVKVKCMECGREWNAKKRSILKKTIKCPTCRLKPNK